jgi:hypothetical protein
MKTLQQGKIIRLIVLDPIAPAPTAISKDDIPPYYLLE